VVMSSSIVFVAPSCVDGEQGTFGAVPEGLIAVIVGRWRFPVASESTAEQLLVSLP
jgi:hypothetical protein